MTLSSLDAKRHSREVLDLRKRAQGFIRNRCRALVGGLFDQHPCALCDSFGLSLEH